MKYKVIAILALGLVSMGCGDENKTKSDPQNLNNPTPVRTYRPTTTGTGTPSTGSYTGHLGSCNKALLGACIDSFYSSTQSIPSYELSNTKSSLDSKCVQGRGAYSKNSKCSISSPVGFCKKSDTQTNSGETLTTTSFIVYSYPYDETLARSECNNHLSGTFTQTKPASYDSK